MTTPAAGPPAAGPPTSGSPVSATATGTAGARPRPVSVADREAFDALVKDSLPAVRSMVVAWRTGLTGLITLVTTGVILTGRTAATSLTPGWRVAVTVTIGGGLALAITGLWHTLAAEAGTRIRLKSLDDILAANAGMQDFQVRLAVAAGNRLQAARALVAAALGLLLTGILLTWWAPPAPADPPAYLKVSRPGGTVCGVLTSADGGLLRLRVDGVHDLVAVPLVTVTNLAVIPSCP